MTIADLKARQEAGEYMLCPRCGRDTMKPNVHTNALSRHADIMVCDEWACFLTDRPQGDFEAVTGEQAWKEIEETQLPFLISLFERWEREGTLEDFGVFRLEAKRKCKGLSDLWQQPFAANYRVSDGVLMIRFRSVCDQTEVVHDVVGHKSTD